MYTSNSGPHTAFVQVGLEDEHALSSFQYMDKVRAKLKKEVPELLGNEEAHTDILIASDVAPAP